MDTFLFNKTAFSNVSDDGGPVVNPELQTKQRSFMLFYDIMTYVILSIGVPGNVLSVAVMCSARLRKAPFSLYLASLAAADTVFLLTSVGLQIFHDHGLIHASDVYCKLIKFLVRSSGYLSAWITTAFTVERYIAVCHPMRRSTLCSMKTTKRVLLGLAIVICSVSCLEFWAQVERDNMCEFRDPETWLNITIYDMAAGRLIPTAAVGVLNTIIATTVLRFSMFIQITIVLFTVSTTFFVLTVPQSIVVVYDLASRTMDDIDEFTFFRKQVIAFTLGLMFKLNFAINFILYSLTGRRFREVVVDVLCRCRGMRRPSYELEEQATNPVQTAVFANMPGTRELSAFDRRRYMTSRTPFHSQVLHMTASDERRIHRSSASSANGPENDITEV
ncbi:PREDICTED: probable G-protein coupled receptor 139 [Branchiostoma belcheri]|uniref:Probable G-protein coupled receptor 139 n=1 Tax=Branchiostoma belcheri TaxID=7741 RepID=A0A6P4ZLT0_BRABE|nr:PREDICTED: probable G-protein coupled receptor 139 [Branchiostoma belcheri]